MADRDVVERLEAMATYVKGCLLGRPHHDDDGAFPATVCEGDYRTLLTAIRRLRSMESGTQVEGWVVGGPEVATIFWGEHSDDFVADPSVKPHAKRVSVYVHPNEGGEG